METEAAIADMKKENLDYIIFWLILNVMDVNVIISSYLGLEFWGQESVKYDLAVTTRIAKQ
jgi:hypothetical protein